MVRAGGVVWFIGSGWVLWRPVTMPGNEGGNKCRFTLGDSWPVSSPIGCWSASRSEGAEEFSAFDT